MKYGVMDELYISSDTLGLGLPVGELGYINAVDPNIYHAQKYCVRVPSKKQTYWVPECDLTASSDYLSQQADDVIRASLVDYALEKRDSATFFSHVRK